MLLEGFVRFALSFFHTLILTLYKTKCQDISRTNYITMIQYPVNGCKGFLMVAIRRERDISQRCLITPRFTWLYPWSAKCPPLPYSRPECLL
ncbi:Uncharacterised protein [Yersinia enterocolitica]|nr:Uncharacterised protein [Yersinia enterocolitica]